MTVRTSIADADIMMKYIRPMLDNTEACAKKKWLLGISISNFVDESCKVKKYTQLSLPFDDWKGGKIHMNKLFIEELRLFTKEYVSTEQFRLESGGWWQIPLLSSAPIDHRFDILPQVAIDEHLHPHDLLGSARTVVVFFIPFKPELINENKKGDRPCKNWGVAYVETNDLINGLSRALESFLNEKGFTSALTPATHNFNEEKLMARWSHKHLAYLSNLGRFGTHNMLITPMGCAGRLGSLVTEADLGDNAVIDTDEACLLKVGKKCGKCIDACPVDALEAESFRRRRCWNRLNENRDILDYFSDLPKTTHVCGKCAALMPCSFMNPVTKL